MKKAAAKKVGAAPKATSNVVEAIRKSTLGKVLGGVPPEERLEATLATTALGIQAGVDIVRVHDVRENVRAARMADAIVRGTWHDPAA